MFASWSDIWSLYVKPDGQVFAGTSHLGVYRAPDLADFFELSSKGLAHTYVRSLSNHTSGDIYAVTRHSRVHRSSDNGITWGLRDGSVPGASVPDMFDADLRYVVTNSDGDVFLASYTDGIYRSTDGGAHWKASSSGLIEDEVPCLLIAPDGHVLAGSYSHGVFRSAQAVE